MRQVADRLEPPGTPPKKGAWPDRARARHAARLARRAGERPAAPRCRPARRPWPDRRPRARRDSAASLETVSAIPAPIHVLGPRSLPGDVDERDDDCAGRLSGGLRRKPRSEPSDRESREQSSGPCSSADAQRAARARPRRSQPAAFAQRAYREAIRRGFDTAAQRVVIGDGAAWIWNPRAIVRPPSSFERTSIEITSAGKQVSLVGRRACGNVQGAGRPLPECPPGTLAAGARRAPGAGRPSPNVPPARSRHGARRSPGRRRLQQPPGDVERAQTHPAVRPMLGEQHHRDVNEVAMRQ